MTDSTTIRVVMPSAMPTTEISVMKDTKPLRRRERVYRSPIASVKGCRMGCEGSPISAVACVRGAHHALSPV